MRAAAHACCERSLLVVADGASWIRTFFAEHLASYPQAEMVLDWSRRQKCRDRGARLCPARLHRTPLLRRVLRALWRGDVSRAVRILVPSDGRALILQPWRSYART